MLTKVSSEPHDDPEKGTHICLLMFAVFLMGVTVGGWLVSFG